MVRMMEKLPRHLHHHRNNNNKTAIDPVAASDDNGNEATDSEQNNLQVLAAPIRAPWSRHSAILSFPPRDRWTN